ncbi:hypothetical protein OIO90_001657 [Microbotryomycetes sp. JL221]|nr:hypothetical protein OIO90_001657 [Microbotryomycetes sp. JL221]
MKVLSCTAVSCVLLSTILVARAERYIVQLHDDHEVDDLFHHLQKRGADHVINQRFTERDIFHGLSLETRDPGHLESFAGVKSIWKVQDVPGPPLVRNPYPSNYTAPPKKGFSLLDPVSVSNQATAAGSSYTGLGITVAIIDSGVDYQHPALGALNTPRKERSCLGASPCKTLKGYDYVGEYFNDPSQDADPLDTCNGHGTAVAGVIGGATRDGSDGMVGVAPDVKFLVYRVFSCPDFDGNSPGGRDDNIIAAISQAVTDGAHIINLSLGGPSGWSGSPLAIAVDNAVAKGKAVFVSAGNDGGQGPLYMGNPGTSKLASGIGAYRNEVYPQWRFRVQPAAGSSAADIAATEGARTFFYIGKHLIGAQSNIGFPIFEPTQTSATCPDIVASPFINSGNMMLIQLPPSSCSLKDFLQKLKNEGADVVLGYLPSGDARKGIDIANMQVVGDEVKLRFGVINTNAEAQRLIKLHSTDPSTQLEFPVEVARPFFVKESDKGSKMEQFSNMGPKWDIKTTVGQPSGPSVSAAGGQIATLAPRDLGFFTIMDGTSFSAPYVAGCAALWFEAWKSLGNARATRVKNAFIQTAKPIFMPPSMTALAPLHQAGAGRIAIADAINARTYFGTNWHELGQSVGLQKRYIPVHNVDTKAITYTVTHRPALDMILYQDTTLSQVQVETTVNTRAPGAVSVAFPVVRFTVPAGEVRNLEIQYTIPLPKGKERIAYSGFIQLAGNDGRPSLRLPYSGIIGKFNTLNVIDRTTTFTTRGLPILMHATAMPNIDTVPAFGAPTIPASARAPDGDIYNVAVGDWPTIVYRLITGAEVLRWNVWNPEKTQRHGHLPGSAGPLRQWSARTKGVAFYAGDRTFELLQWNCLYNSGGVVNVPERTNIEANGRYRLQLQALRPGGVMSNTADYDVWWSPVIECVRNTPDKKAKRDSVKRRTVVQLEKE